MERMRFLGTFGIIREAVRVGIRNPSFIPLATIVSLPLFCITLLHEWLLQHILVEASFSPQLSELPPNSNAVTRLTHMMSGTGRVLLLALLYLIPIQLLNLLTAVTTVYSASAIPCRSQTTSVFHPIGPLTGVRECALASCFYDGDKGCLQALSTSQYLSKGNRVRGICVDALQFYLVIWPILVNPSVRGSFSGRIVLAFVRTGLGCVRKVMKWVVCMVYYHDCKRRCREKVDMEEVLSDLLYLSQIKSGLTIGKAFGILNSHP
ncbi:hypothetical protein CK203_070122 [Vitis vinifera]|uniref:Uncharacterized protein n=1 Tax=Vitis vinifera TaxID=29760 RepID=A0A438EHP3_VITVI|nr:hypothetical protein CK203_070122 [Vitis vinifera]